MLEKQNKKQEEQLPEYDFDKAEAEYISLVIEGETEKAQVLRKEINAENKKMMLALIQNTAKSDEDVKKTVKAEIEEKDFQLMVSTFENKHKFLNPQSKQYNEEAVDTVNTLMRGYLATGVNKAKALEKAVTKTVSMYAIEPTTSKTIGQTRKEEANKKAVQTQKQPSVKSSTKNNVDLTKFKVSDLNEKQFGSLSKDELRRQRGDFL